MRSRINQSTVLYTVDEGLHGTVDIPRLAYITLLVRIMTYVYIFPLYSL